MMFTFVLLLLVHQTYGSSYSIRLNDVDLNCLKESKKPLSYPLKVLSFNIWNDQLSIPGTLDLSLSLNVTKKLSNDVQFSTKIERKFGPAWIDLPCLDGIGGCDKQLLCGLLKKPCKPHDVNRSSGRTTNNLCSCDLDIGTYTIEHVIMNIKRRKSAKLVKPITTGQYRFKVKFSEGKTKTIVGCVIGYLTLLKPNRFT